MDRVVRTIAFTGLVALASCANAEDPRHAQLAGTNPTKLGTTLCALGEQVLFSCQVEDRGKVASLCTSGDVGPTSGYMYYAYGTHDGVELKYPAERAPPAGNFTRTHLLFAGNTGGYAYSFDHPDAKYVIYSVSGSMGLEDQGVLALDESGATQAALKCAPGTLVEDDTESLRALIRELDPDKTIAREGLPLPD